jgi:hypothetical protein
VRLTGRVATVALAALVASSAPAQEARTSPSRARVTFEQASAVIDTLRSQLPVALRGRSNREIQQRWLQWAEQHDRDVRARVARGDEDSLVNLWLYGTSFTAHPPAVDRGLPQSPAALDDVARQRLEDLLDRAATPGGSERLQFAGRVLAARGADPATPDGRERARRVLLETRQRMLREFADAQRTVSAARPSGSGVLAGVNATIFQDRGLSSDTSVLSDFGVQVALERMVAQGTLRPGTVRLAAVIGPGLDFINKADGYDYYEQQTIQPFALVDALRRTHLAAADLRVTTFDISARVNEHLRNAPARADAPAGYVVTLPLAGRQAWTNGVTMYWQQWGALIGQQVQAAAPPAATGTVTARAVRIHPAVVSAVQSRDFNVVVDRLVLQDAERFDLVIATNVLVYYDVFEQALAASNVAAMLRPGGVFVTNSAVLPTAPLKATASYMRVDHTPERYDELFWYQRE